MVAQIRRRVFLVLAAVLIASACGSDSTGGADPDGVEVADVADAAAAYVGALGDEGAFAAILIAFDRGYAIHQVVPAADLTADGTIVGTAPVGQPGGLIDLREGPDGDSARADAEGESMGAGLQVTLVGWGPAPAQGDTAGDPADAALLGFDLTIGEAQRRAAFGEYLQEVGFPEPPEESLTGPGATVEGYQMVMTVMMLAARGYSAEQIVTALVSDTVQADSLLPACLRIPGEVPAIGVTGVTDCPPLPSGDDDGAAEGDDPDGSVGRADDDATNGDGTALERLPTGLHEGTIDTTTGGFRDGVRIDAAAITLQYANGGVLVDWSVSWTEDAGECTTTGTDSWSGSEVTLSDTGSFSIRGTRRFQPGEDSTCELGAEPSSFDRVFRFDVDGTTVTSDVGVGIATIEIGG